MLLGRRAMAIALVAATTTSSPLPAEVTTKRVGRVSITADGTHAWPGGLMVVRLRGTSPPALAILEGRRVPFFSVPGGALRALVPLSVLAPTGELNLGVELRSQGRVRIPVRVHVAPRAYGARTELIPAAKRALLDHPDHAHQGRELLEALRTRTAAQRWRTPFLRPVPPEPVPSFGMAQTWIGGREVEARLDATWGEHHRGLDYAVAAGTPVTSPAAGQVVLSTALVLTGETVVVDHGQGVVSAFYHLSKRAVYPGQPLQAGDRIGLAGETGIAPRPHVHWGVYVNGIAVDPRIFGSPLD